MMKRLIIFLFLTIIGKNGFTQPTPFDAKFVDSIMPHLSSSPDDTNKVNNLVKLASMYLLSLIHI